MAVIRGRGRWGHWQGKTSSHVQKSMLSVIALLVVANCKQAGGGREDQCDASGNCVGENLRSPASIHIVQPRDGGVFRKSDQGLWINLQVPFLNWAFWRRGLETRVFVSGHWNGLRSGRRFGSPILRRGGGFG
eukprot:1860273-Rhodomonas_salina.1